MFKKVILHFFRKKRFIAIIVINIFLFIALISVLEIIGLMLLKKPGGNLIHSWRYNHTWKPSSSWQHNEWASIDPRFIEPYTHYYNKQAWLEKYDVSRKKQENSFRIFYLGDSFIEGPLPMDRSVPSVVESCLNKLALTSGTHFEVINTGTASYSPIIYRLIVEDIVKEYSPDLFVVNIDMTDDYDDWKYSQTAVYDSFRNLIAVPPRSAYGGFSDSSGGTISHNFISRILLFLYKNSHFYNLICQGFQKTASFNELTTIRDNENFYQRWSWCAENWSQQTTKNVETTLSHLAYIVDICKANKVRLFFSSSPHSLQFPQNKDIKPVWSPKIHFILEDFCRRMDVPFLNSYKSMFDYIAETPHEKYYYAYDMHFNPTGYELWSRIHIKFILNPNNKLIPDELLDKPSPSQNIP